jgi:hypothetical protein
MTGMATAAIRASAVVDSVSLVPQPVAVGVAGEGVALLGRFVVVVSRSETRKSGLLEVYAQACSPTSLVPVTEKHKKQQMQKAESLFVWRVV